VEVVHQVVTQALSLVAGHQGFKDHLRVQLKAIQDMAKVDKAVRVDRNDKFD